MKFLTKFAIAERQSPSKRHLLGKIFRIVVTLMTRTTWTMAYLLCLLAPAATMGPTQPQDRQCPQVHGKARECRISRENEIQDRDLTCGPCRQRLTKRDGAKGMVVGE